MRKEYHDYYNDLSLADLQKGLIDKGLFSKDIPDILSSEGLLAHLSGIKILSRKFSYVDYFSNRNINIPRQISIPNPFAYKLLVDNISKNWDKILIYIKKETQPEFHKISQLHIRKLIDGSIFDMSYSNPRDNYEPERKLMGINRFVVKADISNCYPSIYSHAISWALVGKDRARNQKRNHEFWATQLDYFTRLQMENETRGLLIGPVSSNILSEIILINIDNKLRNRYTFVRYIDDYTCFTKTTEEAESFIIDLNEELRSFRLTLNNKKTSINEIPRSISDSWTESIKTYSTLDMNMSYYQMKNFIFHIIRIFDENNRNSAILYYALKIISKKKLEKNALDLYKDYLRNLVYRYPYLMKKLSKYLFDAHAIDKEYIDLIIKDNLKDAILRNDYDTASYCLYFAIKYDICMEDKIDFNRDDIIKELKLKPKDALYYKEYELFFSAKLSKDIVYKTLCYRYDKKKKYSSVKKLYKDHAKELYSIDVDRSWIFTYEVLPVSLLRDNFKALKRTGYSFIKF